MRFENINGRKCLVLDNLDCIYVTTEEYVDSKVVKVECDSNRLNISGTGEVIGKISGNSMLDKVSFPKLLSREDIIEKCDEWLEMFKKVHDDFCRLVLSPQYQKEKVGMALIISSNPDECNKTHEKRKISLNLMNHQNVIQSGVCISTVDDENEGIFKYLALHVVSYYLSKNYNQFIEYSDEDTRFFLTSDYSLNETEMLPMMMFIGSNAHSKEYFDFFRSIFSCHNLGIPTMSMKFDIVNSISNQYISDSFQDSFQESVKQYERIESGKKREDGHVYEKGLLKNGIDRGIH